MLLLRPTPPPVRWSSPPVLPQGSVSAVVPLLSSGPLFPSLLTIAISRQTCTTISHLNKTKSEPLPPCPPSSYHGFPLLKQTFWKESILDLSSFSSLTLFLTCAIQALAPMASKTIFKSHSCQCHWKMTCCQIRRWIFRTTCKLLGAWSSYLLTFSFLSTLFSWLLGGVFWI